MKYFDKNQKELKNGDIINIHQTVNGEDIFIVLNVDTLDIRYRRDLTYKYEYDKEELLTNKPLFGGTLQLDIEWEIVGNIYSDLNEY